MSKREVTKEPSEYDQIILYIYNGGLFQKMFVVVFVAALSFLTGLQYISTFISLTVPDHWCHVPGLENTNYTLLEWKNITIPIEIDINGIYIFSKCTRFADVLHRNEIVKCDHGWDYDQTWYDQTASMQNDWVCDNNMVPTNILAVYRLAELIGTFVFGQMADNFGRMPIFFISVVAILVGRIATVFAASWVYWFYSFGFISFLPRSTIFQSTYIIATEISNVEKRAIVGFAWACGWGLGVMASPLVMWWQRDWKAYYLTTTLPIALFLFLQKWMIESPRWLASRGRNKRCIKTLIKIANTNKTSLPDNIHERLIKVNNEEVDSNIYTMLSLFSSARLAKNTIIIVYNIAIAGFVYTCQIISATNLAGNPYLNYFFMGLLDLPVLLSKYGCDRYGRKFVSIISFLIIVIGCLTMLSVVEDPSKSTVMIIASNLTKFFGFTAFFSLYLHLVELCPTCIRQSGTSLAAIMTNCLGILSPYTVALGFTTNRMIPYGVNASCALLALVGCFFLPETLGYQLPDSIDDAAKFGAEQHFWGWLFQQRKQNPQKHTKVQNETEVPLKNFDI